MDAKTTSRILEGLLVWRGLVEPREGLVEAACGGRTRPSIEGAGCAGDKGRTGAACTLTPRSGDHGRDVIAVKASIGCVKIIDSVKAYGPKHLVSYDSVRGLLGVLSGELNASKGIITTTSDFPPNIMTDPFISPFVPNRLELMNGEALRKWLTDLSKASPG